MPAEGLETWHSQSYAEAWAGEDVLADLLALPRRISAALVADAGLEIERVVDIGAGPGAYLGLFLEAFPTARGSWIDSSDAMQRLARERLPDRVDYLQTDAERLDPAGVPPAQVVVTSRMLHHFSPESQQRFYRTALAVLEPGGFLFNLDHFGAPGDWTSRYRRIRKQFTGARRQELKPHRHDFPLSPVDAHLTWLDEAGFEPADVPWRTFFTALLAARKPEWRRSRAPA